MESDTNRTKVFVCVCVCRHKADVYTHMRVSLWIVAVQWYSPINQSPRVVDLAIFGLFDTPKLANLRPLSNNAPSRTYTNYERDIALNYKPCLHDKSPLPRCNNNNDHIKIYGDTQWTRGMAISYPPGSSFHPPDTFCMHKPSGG